MISEQAIEMAVEQYAQAVKAGAKMLGDELVASGMPKNDAIFTICRRLLIMDLAGMQAAVGLTGPKADQMLLNLFAEIERLVAERN